jgi:hypothetical protein
MNQKSLRMFGWGSLFFALLFAGSCICSVKAQGLSAKFNTDKQLANFKMAEVADNYELADKQIRAPQERMRVAGQQPNVPMRKVYVPDHYATINEAVNSGLNIYIVLRAQRFRENITLIHENAYIVIAAEFAGTATLDGGDTANTIDAGSFKSGYYSTLILKGLNIYNSQEPNGYYNRAAVFSEGGTVLEMYDCFVQTETIGVSTNYAHATIVANCRLVSGRVSSIGIMLSHQNPLGSDTGSRIYKNEFHRMAYGIHGLNSYYPTQLCKGDSPMCKDQNTYIYVAVGYSGIKNGL